MADESDANRTALDRIEERGEKSGRAIGRLEGQSDTDDRALGRIEGQLGEMARTLDRLVDTVSVNHGVLANHVAADATLFATINGSLRSLTDTVDRIKKPVDTFIASRNVLIGIASLLAAVGAVWGYFGGAWHWVYALFAARN